MISNKQKKAILSVVAKEYGISEAAILSRDTNVRILKARKLVIRICSEILDIPYAEIAKILGKDGASTVLFMRDKVIVEDEKE